MKRALDIAGCIVSLPVVLPLLLLCALAVLVTSRGPVVFKEWRLGYKGDPFRMWKFRSAYVNPLDSGEQAVRVTLAGRFLLATGLDELPQLWNVVRGEMSLVGPHADQVDQMLLYAERDRMRLRVKPGVTGLAQVRGRNAISWEQRRLLDVEYVKRHTLRMDVAILWKTMLCVLSGRGLYTTDPPVSPRLL
jgi:lipopolysaccharide/colanic/teichoic acid biosynthesis glycosyltransferase